MEQTPKSEAVSEYALKLKKHTRIVKTLLVCTIVLGLLVLSLGVITLAFARRNYVLARDVAIKTQDSNSTAVAIINTARSIAEQVQKTATNEGSNNVYKGKAQLDGPVGLFTVDSTQLQSELTGRDIEIRDAAGTVVVRGNVISTTGGIVNFTATYVAPGLDATKTYYLTPAN